MKLFTRILAAVLCTALLLGILGCTPNPPEVTSEPTVSLQAAADLYNNAKDALQAQTNLVLDYSYSQTRTVGGQNYSETAAGTASFAGIGTPDAEAVILEDLIYGALEAEYILSYRDSIAYSTVSDCTFSSEASWQTLLDSLLPIVLLDASLYTMATMEETEAGTMITFLAPMAIESWASDSQAALLLSATGTALLDSTGALIKTTYSVQFICGPASYTLEASVAVSAPEVLDLSSLHIQPPAECPALISLDAPKLLLRAVGDIFTAQDISCSISETIYSQAIPLIRTRQGKAAIAGSGDSMVAALENTVQVTDYRNQTTTASQNYAFAGGSCTSSINGADPVAQPGITAAVMRTSIEDAILAGLLAIGYLSGAEMTETDDFYTLKFTGNEAYCQDLSADIGKFLNMDLDGNATSYQTKEAAGYLCINKHTGLPTAMGISFARTHIFGEVPYELTYQLDHSLTLSGVDAYYSATGKLPTEEAPAETATPLFYKVTGPEGQVMWLLGTIHLGDSRTGFLPQAVYDALSSADSLAVEFDILAFEEQAATDQALQAQLAQVYYYLDGTTAADHLDAALYQAAKELILISGNNSTAADQQRIFVWKSYLEAFYLSQGYSLSSQKGVDLRLLQLAKEQGKTVLDIESGLEQLEMLSGFSDAVQAYLLEEALASDCLEYAQSVQQLYDLWCQGDEDALNRALFPDISQWSEDEQALYNAYNDAMIIQRNKAMVQAAKNMLESGESVFYAVGLAHVLGENGLVNSLRAAGYTVELVEYP